MSGSDRLRCLYLDLDGTLLGPGASLLHDGEGAVSIAGVRAVQACLRADVEVVLMSGRRRAQVFEDARLLGQRSFIFEAGACAVVDGEDYWLTGELLPDELTIAEQIERSGAPALLLERYAGLLEYHEPAKQVRDLALQMPRLVVLQQTGVPLEQQRRRTGALDLLGDRELVREQLPGQPVVLTVHHRAGARLEDERALPEQPCVLGHLRTPAPGHQHHLHVSAQARLHGAHAGDRHRPLAVVEQ